MIVVIDYGMGNLRSVQKALETVGAQALITQDPQTIRGAEKVVLPGVGAMQPAMEKLGSLGLIPVIKDSIASGKPFLGICLGLQLLFEKSDEGGEVRGLGILNGRVTKFTDLKVPHMGWNQLRLRDPQCPLFAGIQDGTDVYFCHSYFVRPEDPSVMAAGTSYGLEFASVVAHNNLYAVQFHPEKSQTAGLRILENFTKLSP